LSQRFFPSRSLSAHLKRGGLIAYPTESCYGLGCDPQNRTAVQRLLKLKQRPQSKGLILIASDYRQVSRYLLPLTLDEQKKLMRDGAQAITYLLPTRPSCPRWLRGKNDTLAVRFTSHPIAKKLCHSANSALVSTSANRSGQPPAKTYAQYQRQFSKRALVVPGRVGKRKQPSTIISWVDHKTIRF